MSSVVNVTFEKVPIRSSWPGGVNRTTLVSLPGIRSSIQLFCVKQLVGQNLESELLGVEGKRLFLISNRDAHELNCLDHGRPPDVTQCRRRTRLLESKIKSL